MNQPKPDPLSGFLETLAHLLTPLPDSDETSDLLPEPHREVLATWVERAFGYLQPELIDAHHLDDVQGALVIGNHAVLGIDSLILLPLVYRHSGRVMRPLADRVLIELPGIDRVLGHLGAVVGAPEHAQRLLDRDELVLVYPGGVDDSLKGPDRHYQLPWRGRKGFIRTAIRAQKPIIPIMAAGVDDAYQYLFRERWVGRTLGGSDRYDFPVSLGVGLMPLPVKFTYHVAAPIAPPEGAHLADDEAVVDEMHDRVWRHCQGLLDTAMERWRDEQQTSTRRGEELLWELLSGR